MPYVNIKVTKEGVTSQQKSERCNRTTSECIK